MDLSLEAIEKVVHKGKKYKKIDSFGKEKDAEDLVKKLEKSVCRSKRFPPIIRKMRIGWRLGYRYQVFIPQDLEVK